MSRVDSKKLLRPSVLDRLIDNDPQNQSEVDVGRQQQSKQLRDSVKRDLENLLNTRFSVTSPPEELTQLEKSLFNYGLPDLATLNILNIHARNEFSLRLERVLAEYEPRFKSIKVNYIENKDKADRTLRFRIDAVIYADPLPEMVVFDSVLESITRMVTIKNVSHG
ncbi:MAG: type VI secretion system baseplate subunit TssE [Gammaproteobacteria bacterium]|nr:type VI secretion system baseplate subunit TssE [Gammaproteobacteria bacterium]